jgi:hypothetical protein
MGVNGKRLGYNGFDTQLALKADAAQSDWTAPSLLNSCVNYGGEYDVAGYLKDTMGFVHIKGLIKSGTGDAGTTVFVLPAGCRPAATVIIPTIGADAAEIMSVDTDGNVKLFTASGNSYYVLCGMFKAV